MSAAAIAPQAIYQTAPGQVMAAVPGVTYAPTPVEVGQVQYAVEGGQVAYAAPAEGQVYQVVTEGGQVVQMAEGQQMVEGQEIAYMTVPAEGAGSGVEGGQLMYAAPQMVEGQPAQQMIVGEGGQFQYVVQGAEQPVQYVLPQGEVQQVQQMAFLPQAQPQIISQGEVQQVQQMAFLPQAQPQIIQGGQMMQMTGQAGQAMSYGAPLAPAATVGAGSRVSVSPEIFAKLAAGGVLTPEEMAQLSGQSVTTEVESPGLIAEGAAAASSVTGVATGAASSVTGAAGQVVENSVQAAESSTVSSAKAEKKPKKSLKASKKKSKKGCC